MMLAAALRESLEPPLMNLFDEAASVEQSGTPVAIERYRIQVVALSAVARVHELRGLMYVGGLLADGLNKLLDTQRDAGEAERATLAAWPVNVMTELMGSELPADGRHWAVLNELRTHDWFPQVTGAFLDVIASRLAEDAARLGGDSMLHEVAAFVEPPAPPPPPVASDAVIAHAIVMTQDAEVVTAELFEPAANVEPFDPPSELLFADVDSPETEPAMVEASQAVGVVTRDELMMLHDALAAFAEEFAPQLQAVPDVDVAAAVLEQYADQLENILNATIHLGMNGLQRILEVIQVNAISLQMTPETLTDAQCGLLVTWPQFVQLYLAAPDDELVAERLASVTTDASWPHPASVEALPSWVQSLNAITLVKARVAEQRATIALAEHVELAVPADIDSNVLNSLLLELPQQAQVFSRLVQRLADGGTLEDLDQAQRVAHTLKGAGNTVGVKGVANLTHALEDILAACGREGRLPTPALSQTLIEAADCLEAMSESLVDGSHAPAESLAVYQNVLDWVHLIETDGMPADDLAAPPHTEIVAANRDHDASIDAAIAAATAAAVAVNTSNAGPSANDAIDADDGEAYLRVPVALIDSLMKLDDENSIITSQLQDRIARLTEELNAQRTGTRHISQLSSELEQVIDVRGMAMLSGGTGDLDALEMDQYNELHMLSRRIVESAADAREYTQGLERGAAGLRDLMASKERLQIEIRRSIQRTRMVAVASIAPRLQRAVRQAARVLNRPVQLQVIGEATMVDTQLLSRIMGPLMHMLRNAVDHGMEPAQARADAGKPALGTITLRFATVGANIAVSCADDGAGLHLDDIRDKAIHAGMIGVNDDLTDSQVMRLIMLPGFSTRDEATLMSGRGIGMDVVQRAVSDLRGTIQMHNEVGRGVRFDLLFPGQLSVKQVQISRSLRHLLAISERGVQQLLPVSNDYVIDAAGGSTYLLQGQPIPALRLEQLLDLPATALRQPDAMEVVMIVIDERQQRFAVVVPELNQSRNVVVKPFAALIPRAIGVDGATILGDGSVAPVIDLPDLLRAYRDQGATTTMIADATLMATLPLCLIVDDSVSVRRTMEQLMQDAGYEVISARDGLDALGAVQRRTPDIVLVDLEMPRMNGLQLTNALRNQTATKNTPVVMITSRYTDKHRKLADEAGADVFLTKPYGEEELLATVEHLLRTPREQRLVSLASVAAE